MRLAQYHVRARTSVQPAISSRRSGCRGTSDREPGEPGHDIGGECDAAGTRPVDDDAAEGQQRHAREHPADQDDGQPGRRAGRGHDREGKRGGGDRVSERVDDPPGERILKSLGRRG